MNETVRVGTIEGPIEETTESARGGEELLRAITRLKLRLELCLRRERVEEEYKATLARCLDDVDQVVRAASVVVSRHPRRRF